MKISEEFIQFIWKNRLFEDSSLKTTEHEKLEILETGVQNFNAGPDFLNARVKIGNTLWAGNIEIHINSSDWHKHEHGRDKAYSNVILHVVVNHDMEIYRSESEKIPTIKINYKPKLFDNYLQLVDAEKWIPCQSEINKVDNFFVTHWISKLTIERLENKANSIKEQLLENNNHWEEVFYRQIARNFGYKINAEPFEWLAKSLPINIIAKHKNNISQIEALLFGQAGFLEKELEDDYFKMLKKEYDFLKHKYRLKPLQEHLWKFLRLRPLNFPTVRIAQFAQLINQSSGLFSKILESKEIKSIHSLLEVSTSEYWQSNYSFSSKSKPMNKKLGAATKNSIIINTIVPFLFVYGELKDNQYYKNKSIEYLEQTQPESNSTISKWEKIGIMAENAYITQALLQLKNMYCDKKKCLNCLIGNKIIVN